MEAGVVDRVDQPDGSHRPVVAVENEVVGSSHREAQVDAGAVTLTRAFNPAIMTWAAIWAIALSFIGKLGALLQTIPTPVMGGILVLLFGAITVVGLSSLMSSRDDLLKPRNLVIVSMILVLGLGGMEIPIGNFALGGIGLAGIVGIALNLVLPTEAASDAEA